MARPVKTGNRRGRTDQSEVCCFIATLPPEESVGAAEDARAINPQNSPVTYLLPAVLTAVVDSPANIAVLTSKYWGKDGVNLGVGFVDNPNAATRKKILAYMNLWGNYANVKFYETSTSPQVRIDRGPGGYWSYLGTDILRIPASKPTMNLAGFTERTPDAEYNRVVTHEAGHCLAGNTLIDCPRDLSQHPFGIPISNLVGKQPWVYAWKDGRIVVRKATKVWLSKRNAATVRVKLKTGRGVRSKHFETPLELVGTLDHPVLLADGTTWKNLGDLKPGDRLCSLYRSKNGNRSRITWTGLGDRVREHQFVAESVHGVMTKEYHCHHKDENQLNQSVDNLEWKLGEDHLSDHNKGRKRNPESVAKSAAFWRGRHHTEESRAKMSASRKGKRLSEEAKKKVGEFFRGKKQSPELVASRMAGLAKYYANGGKAPMEGKPQSAESRAKRSATMKATLARKRSAVANHVVVSVEPWLYQDVYDMTVPDADSFVANGVVVHNSLGFPHEHMRAAIIEQLDYEKTVAYFNRTQGWSRQEVIQQVLTPVEERTILATQLADETSVMCYQLPGSITKTGKPILGGSGITAADGAFAGQIYPRADVTPPVQPAADPIIIKMWGATRVEIPGYKVTKLS